MFRKKLTAILVALSFLAVYVPMALFAAVSASSQVSGVGTDRATVTFYVDEGATINSVNLSLTPNEGSIGVSGSAVTITGLTPNKAYNYSATVAYTEADGSTPGSTSAGGGFTTESIPAASLTINSVTVGNSTTGTADVTANFTASNCDVLNSSYFTVSPNTGVSTSTVSVTSSTVKTTLSGLTGGQTYQITARVRYKDLSNVEQEKASTQQSYTHPATSVAPTVTVSTPTYVMTTGTNANVTFSGMITNTGSSSVTDAGFVYSTTNSNPTIGGTGCTQLGIKSGLAANTTNVDLSTTVGFSSNQTVYVKSYAISAAGTTLSDMKSVAITNTGTVPTVTVNTPAYTISGSSATVTFTGTVTNAGSQPVTDAGFVYSTINTQPSIGGANCTQKSAISTDVAANGSRTLTSQAASVSAGSTVYVRTYAISTAGTAYSSSTAQVITTTTTAPTLTTGTVSGVTFNTATPSVTVSSVGSGITTVGIVYSTSSTATLQRGATNTSYKEDSMTATGTKTFSLISLNSNTTYYVKAYAYSNASSPTYATNTVQFTTSAVTLPTVTTNAASSIAANSATVGAYISNVGSGITTAGVVYSTSSSASLTRGATNTSYKEASMTTTGTKSIELTGLSANTTYYAKAYAYSSTSNIGYHSSYIKFTTSETQSAYAPDATTTSVSEITSTTAVVDINITDDNGYSITERGVVYSKYNSVSTPEVGVSGCSKETASGTAKTGKTTVTLTGLTPGEKYAVRAYARNSKGYGYGSVRTFTTEDYDDKPTVLTETVTRVSDTEVDVQIYITSSGEASISESGVVYSRTSSLPTISSSSTSKKSSGKTSTGRTTVSLTGLTSGSSYYVRAYATNKYGTAYGAVKQVDEDGDGDVTTNSVTDITGSSATVGGYVSSSVNSDVTERGVVYSKTSTSPTTSDNRIKSDKTTYGSYSMTLSGLDANTKYYVRAYVRISGSYSYGNTVNFTTSNTNLTITVLYKTQDGLQVGNQTLNVAYGGLITQSSLYLPSGYTLVNSTFSHTATTATSVTVTVKKSGQNAFMEGSSNYMFEPDKKITRIEVAKMIYSLKGSVYVGEGMKFSDMPTGDTELAALKYVTSMNYMVGNPDGTFRPYDPITRAEVVVVCCTVYNLQSNDMTNPFSDTNNHWGKSYITLGYRNRMLFGYPDGTFKPDNNMTRAEAAVVFTSAEKRDLEPLSTTNFVDVPSSHWAYKYIMNAAIPKK